MADLKFTVDRPTLNTAENHNARLAQLDLRYGATHIYKDSKGTYWATGDYAHNNGNIEHNIKRMVEIMQAEGLTYMGKAYDSDIYKSTVRINSKLATWEEILRDCDTDHLTAVNPILPIEVLPVNKEE
jgi:hypothetical protein